MTQRRLTPYLDKSSGLGTFLKFNDRWFNHNGSNWGFANMYYGSMEGGNGFVIMTNCNNYLIMDEIAKALAEVYGWKEFQIADTYPLLQSIPDSLMAKYTGQFRSESGKTDIVIRRTGNALSAVFNDGPACKMYFTKRESFVITEDPTTYTFSGDTLKLWTGRPPAVHFLRKK